MKKLHTIKSKIIVTLLLCFVLPFVIQIILANNNIIKIVEEKIYNLAYKNVENAALNMANTFQTQFDIAWYFRGDSAFVSAVQQIGELSESDLSILKNKLTNKLTSGTNIDIYSFQFEFLLLDYTGHMITTYTYAPNANYKEIYNNIAKEEWFSRLRNSHTDKVVMFSAQDYLNSREGSKFYIATNIVDSENNGVLIIAVDEIYISKLLAGILLEDDGYIVSENDECILSVYGNTLDYDTQVMDTYLENKKLLHQNGILQVKLAGQKNKQYLILCKEIVIKGYRDSWYLVSVVPAGDILEELVNIRVVNILIILLYVSAIIWVAYQLNQDIAKPIIILRDSVKKVTDGDLTVEIRRLPDNEFRQLESGFNRMVQNLNLYFTDIKLKEKQKRKIEIRLLQNQIKPHFIRNTLNTIRWLAEINGATSVSKSITAFSGMLDYNFRDVELFATIGDEISYVKKYLFLQNLRFQNKFKDEYDIDEQLMPMKTLKLSLQPIVENCIYHGILPKDSLGTIRIEGRLQESGIFITITDNGVGMDQKRIDAALIPKSDDVIETTKGTENIALWNINQRIKLYFGDAYGIKIMSTPGTGTKVILHIPIITEEIDNENINS